MNLIGKTILLRALEPEDIDFLYQIENDMSLWELSHTQTPYSKWVLKSYLENAHQDIYEAKQLRLAIVYQSTQQLIGLIDLFDFDPKNCRAGLGIIIQETFREKGIGREALQIITNYAFSQLHLHQIYVNIGSNNEASLNLFTKFGFEKIGIKKQWNKGQYEFEDEIMFQYINPNL